MEEQWKYLWGFSRYMISDMGRIKSRENGLFVQPDKASDGSYKVVLTANNGVKLIKAVHRLVADTFMYDWSGYSPIYFIDGNKGNYRLSNLTRDATLAPEPVRKKQSKYIPLEPDEEELKEARDRKLALARALAARRRPPKQESAQVVPLLGSANRIRGTDQDKSRKNALPNRPTAQQVRVKETGEVYPSQSACGRALGVGQSAISAVLRKKMRTAGGYTFEYVSEETDV